MFMFFWLEPKEPKVQAPANAPPPGRPTHNNTPKDCIVFSDLEWKDENSSACYAKTRGRCVPPCFD